MQKETQYLGCIISEDGIMAATDKVRVMRQMPPLTCEGGIRSFIGMWTYYIRSIPNILAIAKPFLRLARKFTQFERNKECQATFDFLKDRLKIVPALAYPDSSKLDSSENFIEACLFQVKDKPGKMKSNEPMKTLLPICHINLQLHRQNSLQLKKRLLLSFMLYKN